MVFKVDLHTYSQLHSHCFCNYQGVALYFYFSDKETKNEIVNNFLGNRRHLKRRKNWYYSLAQRQKQTPVEVVDSSPQTQSFGLMKLGP